MNAMKDETFGSGNGTTHVYVVEAKSTYKEIILNAGPPCPLVLTPHDWKRVPVGVSPIGVPNHLSSLWPEAERQGFLTYACAMALACWLQATRDYGGIVTRLVQIEFTSSYSTKLLGRSEPLDLQEQDRELFHALQKQRSEQPQSADAIGQR